MMWWLWTNITFKSYFGLILKIENTDKSNSLCCDEETTTTLCNCCFKREITGASLIASGLVPITTIILSLFKNLTII